MDISAVCVCVCVCVCINKLLSSLSPVQDLLLAVILSLSTSRFRSSAAAPGLELQSSLLRDAPEPSERFEPTALSCVSMLFGANNPVNDHISRLAGVWQELVEAPRFRLITRPHVVAVRLTTLRLFGFTVRSSSENVD